MYHFKITDSHFTDLHLRDKLRKSSNQVFKQAGKDYKEFWQQGEKTNPGAGNLIVFLLYSFTGIDSHFTEMVDSA